MNLRMSASETKCCVLVLDWKLNWMNATTASKKSTSTSDECQHLNILFCYFTLNYHQISEFEWKCDSNDDKDDDNDVDQFIKCVTMSRYKLWALNLLRTIEKEQGKKSKQLHHQRTDRTGRTSRLLRKKTVCRCYYWMKICNFRDPHHPTASTSSSSESSKQAYLDKK